ncbi:MAG: FkbM family methyltransferase [Saprospiraceae bacterium]
MNIVQRIKSKHAYHVFRDKLFSIYYKMLSIQYSFKKKKGILVYLGMNYGKSFDKLYWQYEKAIGIEANPELAQYLKHKYRNAKNVEIKHGAATDFEGEIPFNISENHGLSSSIGTPKSNAIKTIKQVRVPAFNLYHFLNQRGIHHIDDYISDIQGNDLTVLQTLQPMLEQEQITCITSEVAKNEYRNSYEGLPDNSLDGFEKLLGSRYKLVSTGWEDLKENQFNEVPSDWWEMDCMWKLKSKIGASKQIEG